MARRPVRDRNLYKIYITAIEALKHKVEGYTATECKTTYTSDAAGNKAVKDEVYTTKYFPPDLSAIVFVLTNLAPGQWRQKQAELSDAPGAETIEQPDLSRLSETALRELDELCKK